MASDVRCVCPCHTHSGTYPPPCNVCGHDTREGRWVGGYRGWWEPNNDPRDEQIARLQALLAERDAEIARLVERVAELEAGTHALDSLADIACVHGRAFDSNEYADWDSYCSVCAAMRPLAAALSQADDGGRS